MVKIAMFLLKKNVGIHIQIDVPGMLLRSIIFRYQNNTHH